MITISIVGGEIHLQHETAEERAAMHKTYEDEQGLLKRLYVAEHPDESEKGSPEAETPRDQTETLDSESYRAGWAAASGLAAVAYDKGEIVEFLANNVEGYKGPETEHPYDAASKVVLDASESQLEALKNRIGEVLDVNGVDHRIVGFTRKSSGFELQVVPLGTENPPILIAEPSAPEFVEEPLFTMEYAQDADTSIEAAHPAIRPAVDSGEPEKEVLAENEGSEGTWTLTQEELDSRLQAEYERGKGDNASAPRPTTAKTLHQMTREWLSMDDDDLRDPSEYMITVGKESIDGRFVEHLAKRLGYTVS